jgi:signal peptidase I
MLTNMGEERAIQVERVSLGALARDLCALALTPWTRFRSDPPRVEVEGSLPLVVGVGYLGLLGVLGSSSPELLGLGPGWHPLAPVACVVAAFMQLAFRVLAGSLAFGLALAVLRGLAGLEALVAYVALALTIAGTVADLGRELMGAAGPSPVEHLLVLYTVAWGLVALRALSAMGWARTVLALLAATALLALGGELVPRPFLRQWRVATGGMRPTLEPDDRVRLSPVGVLLREPRGEGGVPLVGRVVGLPGEQLAWDRSEVTVDGAPLDQLYLDPRLDWTPYASVRPGTFAVVGGGWTVPPGEYFILGDNRPAAEDSRRLGPISRLALRGLVVE